MKSRIAPAPLNQMSYGFLILLLSLGAIISHAKSAKADPNSKNWIIVFKKSVSDSEAEANVLTAKHALTNERVYKYALKGMSASVPDSKLDKIKKDPNVAYVFPDLVGRPKGITVEPYFTPEFYTTELKRIGLPGLPHDLPENTGQGVGIAILDDGIDRSHPDFRLNAAPGVKGESTIESYHDCVNGEGHDAYGTHGTGMAGLIYPQPNDFGLIGLAPGSSLFDVRVMDADVGKGRKDVKISLSSVLCGIDFVTANAPANGGPIQVANMSFGLSLEQVNPNSNFQFLGNYCGISPPPGLEDPFHQALCNGRDAGVIWVTSAGNEGGLVIDDSFSAPAPYDDAVITVSALANSEDIPGIGHFSCDDGFFPVGVILDNTFTTFSAHGPEVDLAAPACLVGTVAPMDQNIVEHFVNFENGIKSKFTYIPYRLAHGGTSAASAIVSGAVALWINKYKGHPDFDIYQDTYDPNDKGFKDRLLKLVLHGTNPNNVEFDPNETIPGLIDLSEKINEEDCQNPPSACLERPEDPCEDLQCPHWNYVIAPDGSEQHYHPEPVLDVGALMDL